MPIANHLYHLQTLKHSRKRNSSVLYCLQFPIRRVEPGVALRLANLAVLSESLLASICFSPYTYQGIFLMLAILCITSLLASRVVNRYNLTFYTSMEWITGLTEGKIVFFKLSVSRRNHTSLNDVPKVTLISFYYTLLEPLFYVLFRSHPESGISLTCLGVLRFENMPPKSPLENVWGKHAWFRPF